MLDWLADPQAWVALATLTVLEIVLGIDNVIFISILAGKVPAERQASARRLGLAAAMLTRIALLLSLTWMMRLTNPLVSPFGHPVTGKDLILLAGGLFLIYKATREIHEKLEGGGDHHAASGRKVSFAGVIVQIMLLDIVFSLDSVITAVGMANHLPVMILAVILAVCVMLVFSGPVSRFVDRHPTVKMLALSFLLLIGVNLLADGSGIHIPKGYTYVAMGFSMFVESLNLRLAAKSRPVELHSRYER